MNRSTLPLVDACRALQLSRDQAMRLIAIGLLPAEQDVSRRWHVSGYAVEQRLAGRDWREIEHPVRIVSAAPSEAA